MTDPSPFGTRTEITAAEYQSWLAGQGQTIFVPLDAETEPAWQTSEKVFMARVARFATEHTWLVYHTWKSANSAPGFCDLVMCRETRLIFAELKTETGRVMPDQQRWLDDLSKVRGVEVYLWRPADWSEITEVLA